jgi:hypothetical protein
VFSGKGEFFQIAQESFEELASINNIYKKKLNMK